MKKKWWFTIILFVMAIAFTIAVKFIDVQAIGPLGSSVGFASLNGKIFEFLGANSRWDKICDVTMLSVFASGSIFAVMGACQLLKRKNLLKVDWSILSLGIVYVLLGVFYAFFEFVTVNYRPTLDTSVLESNCSVDINCLYEESAISEILKASFPSSHMLLVIVVGVTVMMILPKYLKNKGVCIMVDILLSCLVFLMIAGRLLSGMHWATDILAGILYGAALISLYANLRTTKPKGVINE